LNNATVVAIAEHDIQNPGGFFVSEAAGFVSKGFTTIYIR